MSDEQHPGIPIESFSDPVIEYVVSGDRPRIAATNDAFDVAFGPAKVDSSVGELFDRFGIVESTGDDDPETHIVQGDDVGIFLDGFDIEETYFVRIVTSKERTGYLVFDEVSEYRDVLAMVGVGEVAGVLSHDLRNPLDVAKAHLRAAAETGDGKHFDAVDSAHERMSQIIEDVLTLAQGADALDRSQGVSITNAVDEAWQSVDTGRAELRTPDTLPTTTADSDRLRRLFENLFRNAVEHGSATATVASGSGETGNHDRARNVPPRELLREEDHDHPSGVTISVGALENGFYVADDGPGIEPSERETVFDPGYTSAEQGTGLGLSIVERIVAAHDWQISLTTAGNGGARFEVRFS